MSSLMLPMKCSTTTQWVTAIKVNMDVTSVIRCYAPTAPGDVGIFPTIVVFTSSGNYPEDSNIVVVTAEEDFASVWLDIKTFNVIFTYVIFQFMEDVKGVTIQHKSASY